jgi:hypothetical protein
MGPCQQMTVSRKTYRVNAFSDRERRGPALDPIYVSRPKKIDRVMKTVSVFLLTVPLI